MCWEPVLNGFGECASLVAGEGLSLTYTHTFLVPSSFFDIQLYKQNSIFSASSTWNFNFLISLQRKLKIRLVPHGGEWLQTLFKINYTIGGTHNFVKLLILVTYIWGGQGGYQIRKLKSIEITESDSSLCSSFLPRCTIWDADHS